MPTLEASEARRRFAAARVARLATADGDGRPHLVPVVFAVDGDTVLVAVDQKPKRRRRLKRLANVEANPAVSLLADHYSDDWAQLWWVRADGEAAVSDDEDTLGRTRRLLAERYRQHADEPPDGPVLAIGVSRWSGWTASGC